MIDIDKFKPYNDQHGHALGRRSHQAGGRGAAPPRPQADVRLPLWRRRILLILPGTGPEAAASLAERLRASVAAARGDETGITVSVGYAALTADEFATPDKLFEAADAALYSAKEAGRNRVAQFHGRRTERLPRRTTQTSA